MIIIKLITDLINNLPSIISYIMYGYIFLSVYQFITFKDMKDQKYKIITSIVLNYVLLKAYELIPRIPHNNVILYVVITVVIAYVIGRVVVSNWWNNKILLRLGIHRTVNEDTWKDILKTDGYGIEISEKGSDISYYGAVKYADNHSDHPVVALSYYGVYDGNKLIEDHLQDKNHLIAVKITDNTIVRVVPPKKA